MLTVRELTEAEKGDLRYGCIFCKQRLFWMGPSALGLSFNIYCVDCRAGFNVTHAGLPWQCIAKPGERDLESLASIVDGKMDVADFFAQMDASLRERFATRAVGALAEATGAADADLVAIYSRMARILGAEFGTVDGGVGLGAVDFQFQVDGVTYYVQVSRRPS